MSESIVAATLTDQQRAALEPNGCSIALSAGAGCGKTRVLTERFLLHLAPGAARLRIAQLAALTFTERAAREMRDRIRRRCHERMLACPASEATHWQGVARDLETARISTIHAFCANVLRAHCVEAALDPRFRVADETTAGALLHRVAEQTLFDRLAAGDADGAELVLAYGVARVQRWLGALAAECDPRSMDRWRGREAKELALHWQECWEADGLRREARRLMRADQTQSLLELLRSTPSADAVMQQRRAWLVEHLPGLPEGPALAARLRDVQEHARVQGGGLERAWPSPDVYHRVRSGLKKLRDQAKRLSDLSCNREAVTAEAAAQGMRLLRMTGHVLEAYDRAKADAALVDFRDLLVRTRDLLAACPPARDALSAALRLILVDEFQDTDPIQVEILRQLCGEELARGKLFIVGDAKQAIYRFRRADPRLFARLRGELPEEGRKSITKNFRSQPALLRFVNRLFCETLGPDYEPLVAETRQATAAPNVQFLWTKIAPTKEAKQQRRRFEARSIARRIQEMLDAGEPAVMDRAEGAESAVAAPRPPRMGDIAILFRALSDVRYYEEALRREGLDYYLVGGHGFFAQQEIWDLLNLLRAVQDPDDAVSLAGALRSPFFSLRDETFYWLSDGRGDLEGGLHAPERWAAMDAQQRRRVAFAAGVLEQLRAVKDRLPLSELLQRVFDLTGYDAVVLAEFLGPRKLANLRKIRSAARQFDAAGLFTLADFIVQLEDSVARQPREEQAATHPEKSNVVRLMTIHQAKGLEFPIVFVPDLERRQRYGPRGAVLHPEVGPVVPPTWGESHLGLELCKALEREEQEREEQRLFYVACTRAADYLVLSASVSDLEKPSSPWMRVLAGRFDLAGGRAFGSSEEETPDASVRFAGPDDAQPTGRLERGGRLPNWSQVAEKALSAVSGAGTLPKAVAPIAPALERRRAFSPAELAAAWRQRQQREELPLFRFAEPDAQAGVDEIVLAQGRASAQAPELRPGARVTNAALLGSTVHAVLRCVDFPSACGGIDAARWEGLVRQCAAEVDPTEARLDIGEARELVERFLAGPVAAELAEAAVCHRELEFLLRWPPQGARSAGEAGTGSVQRYLRGFLDCLYQDRRGGWHLLDYKTDEVDAPGVAERAEQYRLQLAVYTLAARRMLGEKLESARLYFLRPDVAWRLEMGAAWEDRTVREVDAAIVELVTRPEAG